MSLDAQKKPLPEEEGQFFQGRQRSDLLRKTGEAPPKGSFTVKVVELSGIEPLTS